MLISCWKHFDPIDFYLTEFEIIPYLSNRMYSPIQHQRKILLMDPDTLSTLYQALMYNLEKSEIRNFALSDLYFIMVNIWQIMFALENSNVSNYSFQLGR